MNDDRPDRCPILPPGEQKCLWMTAGILGYQLCDRGFDCERCPLDAALRASFGHGHPAAPRAAEGPGGPAAPAASLADDRKYSRGHCWVRPINDADPAHPLCRVGLEPGLAAAMLRPRSIVLPPVGEELHRGQVHLWLVTDGGTFVVAAPAAGRVKRVNPRLVDRPSLAISAPLDEGWLYEIEASGPLAELPGLLDAAPASRRFDLRRRRFQGEIVRAMGAGLAEVGPTLPDGGELIGNVSEMLGVRRYFDLLTKIYG